MVYTMPEIIFCIVKKPLRKLITKLMKWIPSPFPLSMQFCPCHFTFNPIVTTYLLSFQSIWWLMKNEQIMGLVSLSDQFSSNPCAQQLGLYGNITGRCFHTWLEWLCTGTVLHYSSVGGLFTNLDIQGATAKLHPL